MDAKVVSMKKLLLKLVALALFGAAAYGAFLYFVTPETVYCARLVQLCELEGQEPLDLCQDVLGAVAEKDTATVRKAATCAVEAPSCTRAAGCLFGAGTAVGLKELKKLVPLVRKSPGIMGDFLDGIKEGAGDLLK